MFSIMGFEIVESGYKFKFCLLLVVKYWVVILFF